MDVRVTAFRSAFIVALGGSAAEILAFHAGYIVVGPKILFRILPETRNRSIEEIELQTTRPGVASA